MPKIGERIVLHAQRGGYDGVNLYIDGRNYILLEQYSDGEKSVILNSSKRVGYVYKQVIVYDVDPSDFYAANSNLFIGSKQVKKFPDTNTLLVTFHTLNAAIEAYKKIKLSSSTTKATVPVFFNEMSIKQVTLSQ